MKEKHQQKQKKNYNKNVKQLQQKWDNTEVGAD